MAKEIKMSDTEHGKAVLAIAREIGDPDLKWTSDQHRRLIWLVFIRLMGYRMPGTDIPKDQDPDGKQVLAAKQAAWQKFCKYYDEGKLAYASNCAKALAKEGVCASTEASTEASGEVPE